MADDFPAAHSMDTTWFAVDADGRVGLFESYEAGAVPRRFLEAARVQYGFYDFVAELPLDDDGVWHSPVRAATVVDGLTAARLRADWRFWESLLHLRDAAAIALLEPQESPIVRLAGQPVVVITDTRSDRVRALLDAGHVLGGRPFDDADEVAALMGLHVYAHGDAWENWISGPYTRVHAPAEALTADQLPSALARVVDAVRFGRLRFAETDNIQPVRHEDCASWERQWVDLDGTRHPMPGKE